MYKITQDHFGSFEKFTLESPDGEDKFSVIPSFGATMIDLQLAGHFILEGYETVDELLAYKTFKSGVLLPFPNRLKGGRYIWNNDVYSFFINDSITGNALHGFALDKKFEAVKTEIYEDRASINCRYEYNGDIANYPFPFTFEIRFELKAAASLFISMVFYNDGSEAIPVGLGWHPYFKLGDTIDNLNLKMSPCEMVGVDKYMIPTGKRYEYTEFLEPKRIGATVLDNCFALSNSNNKIAKVELTSDRMKLTYWQKKGESQFNFLQIYTHPDRESIAIEPMTCNIDALNNGEGLVVLLPNEKVEVSCGVGVETVVR